LDAGILQLLDPQLQFQINPWGGKTRRWGDKLLLGHPLPSPAFQLFKEKSISSLPISAKRLSAQKQTRNHPESSCPHFQVLKNGFAANLFVNDELDRPSGSAPERTTSKLSVLSSGAKKISRIKSQKRVGG